jgi:hypothetical protein
MQSLNPTALIALSANKLLSAEQNLHKVNAEVKVGVELAQESKTPAM